MLICSGKFVLQWAMVGDRKGTFGHPYEEMGE